MNNDTECYENKKGGHLFTEDELHLKDCIVMIF